jgi:hypothetical protein
VVLGVDATDADRRARTPFVCTHACVCLGVSSSTHPPHGNSLAFREDGSLARSFENQVTWGEEDACLLRINRAPLIYSLNCSFATLHIFTIPFLLKVWEWLEHRYYIKSYIEITKQFDSCCNLDIYRPHNKDLCSSNSVIFSGFFTNVLNPFPRVASKGGSAKPLLLLPTLLPQPPTAVETSWQAKPRLSDEGWRANVSSPPLAVGDPWPQRCHRPWTSGVRGGT